MRPRAPAMGEWQRRRWNSGSRKAAVLPLPVRAMATTSLPGGARRRQGSAASLAFGGRALQFIQRRRQACGADRGEGNGGGRRAGKDDGQRLALDRRRHAEAARAREQVRCCKRLQRLLGGVESSRWPVKSAACAPFPSHRLEQLRDEAHRLCESAARIHQALTQSMLRKISTNKDTEQDSNTPKPPPFNFLSFLSRLRENNSFVTNIYF